LRVAAGIADFIVQSLKYHDIVVVAERTDIGLLHGNAKNAISLAFRSRYMAQN
jgi:hypothetical protein